MALTSPFSSRRYVFAKPAYFSELLVDFHAHTNCFSFSFPASNVLFLVLNIMSGVPYRIDSSFAKMISEWSITIQTR